MEKYKVESFCQTNTLLISITKIIFKALHSFFLKPATKKEVISFAKEKETNKSTGPNSIPMQILKIK